ncbi:MAG: hypothetical protein R3D60_03425 [Paracoccaceae bacterium]
MPLEDIFGDLMAAGADGKRGAMSRTALVCAVIGGAIGGYLGFGHSVAYAVGGGVLGLFLGWVAGLLLRGVAVLAVFFVVLLPIVLAWKWLTGAFG